MTSTITQQLKETIEANLPALVAGELKEFINQAEKDKRDLESYQNTCRILQESCDKKADEISGLKAKLDEHAAIDTREKTITARENELRVTIAEVMQKETEKRSSDVLTLAGVIFKNNVIRRSVSECATHNFEYDSATGRNIKTPSGKSIIETTEED